MTADELRGKMEAITTNIVPGAPDTVTQMAVLRFTIYECTLAIVDRLDDIHAAILLDN